MKKCFKFEQFDNCLIQLTVAPQLVLPVKGQRTSITLKSFYTEMLLPYVQCELIIALHGFSAIRTDSFFTWIADFAVDVSAVANYIETSKGSVFTEVAVEIFNSDMHPSNM